MTSYAVVYERTSNNLRSKRPGPARVCRNGRTKREVERRIRAAIELHLEGMREDGEAPPPPTTSTGSVEVDH